jgi:hypothetical protein
MCAIAKLPLALALVSLAGLMIGLQLLRAIDLVAVPLGCRHEQGRLSWRHRTEEREQRQRGRKAKENSRAANKSNKEGAENQAHQQQLIPLY